MTFRVRKTRGGGLFRKGLYELELWDSASCSWVAKGELRFYQLTPTFKEAGLHTREESEVWLWAEEAFKSGDTRWVYPHSGTIEPEFFED